MWQTFRASFAAAAQPIWTERSYLAQTVWDGATPVEGSALHIRAAPEGLPYALAPDGSVLGRMIL